MLHLNSIESEFDFNAGTSFDASRMFLVLSVPQSRLFSDN